MLISCVAYQDGTKIGDITVAQIPEYLHRPRCFVWVTMKRLAAYAALLAIPTMIAAIDVLLYFRFKRAKWL